MPIINESKRHLIIVPFKKMGGMSCFSSIYLSYYFVRSFAVASAEYVTTNLSPFNVWNAIAFPTKGVEPEATGVPLGVFTKLIATLPFPNGAVNGWPCAASAVTLELYPCNTTTSTGLLAVHVTIPTHTFPSLLGGIAITSW